MQSRRGMHWCEHFPNQSSWIISSHIRLRLVNWSDRLPSARITNINRWIFQMNPSLVFSSSFLLQKKENNHPTELLNGIHGCHCEELKSFFNFFPFFLRLLSQFENGKLIVNSLPAPSHRISFVWSLDVKSKNMAKETSSTRLLRTRHISCFYCIALSFFTLSVVLFALSSEESKALGHGQSRTPVIICASLILVLSLLIFVWATYYAVGYFRLKKHQQLSQAARMATVFSNAAFTVDECRTDERANPISSIR